MLCGVSGGNRAATAIAAGASACALSVVLCVLSFSCRRIPQICNPLAFIGGRFAFTRGDVPGVGLRVTTVSLRSTTDIRVVRFVQQSVRGRCPAR